MAVEEEEGVQPEIEETDETPEGETEEEAVEGEEPEAEEAEGEEGEAEESSSDRRARRTQTLANRAREAELEIARLKGENEALKKPAPAADQGEAARVRAEKLALMDPAERKTFELEETVQRLQQGQALTSLQIQDATDQARYDAKSTLNPIYSKHKDAVESALADMRRKGTNAPREESSGVDRRQGGTDGETVEGGESCSRRADESRSRQAGIGSAAT